MVEIYQNLARHMPDNGMQMVMFTHQDPAVWADLGMILWAAGLKPPLHGPSARRPRLEALRRATMFRAPCALFCANALGSEPGFLDEVYPLVEDEVKRQIDFDAGARRRWRAQLQRR